MPAETLAERKEYTGTHPCDEDSLLPGDQVWLKNTFYVRGKSPGLEGGSNTFVVGRNGNGRPLLYNHTWDNVMNIDDFRRKWMGSWDSVRAAKVSPNIDFSRPPYFRVLVVLRPKAPDPNSPLVTWGR